MRKYLFCCGMLSLTGCLHYYQFLASNAPDSESRIYKQEEKTSASSYDSSLKAQKNPREFYQWAADQGHPQAMEIIGLILIEQEPKDLNRGLSYLEQAWQKGQNTAGLELAKIYAKAEVVERDISKALKYLESSLEAKSVPALLLAAQLIEEQGQSAQAIAYLELAVQAGDPFAKEQLAKLMIHYKPGSWNKAQELGWEAQQEGLYQELLDLKEFWPSLEPKDQAVILGAPMGSSENQNFMHFSDIKNQEDLSLMGSKDKSFLQIFKEAAGSGSPYAAYQRALQKIMSPTSSKDNAQDVESLLNSASESIVAAKITKARLIMQGYWQGKNTDEALYLLREASSENNPYALFALSLFERNLGNYEDSIKLYKKGVSQPGYGASLHLVATDLLKGYYPFIDDHLAQDWLLDLASQGHHLSLLEVARLKEQNKLYSATDDEAFILRLKAAWEGNARAQYEVGNMYLKGQSVDADSLRAFRWFNAAARKGYQPAQYQLSLMYEAGDGVFKDLPKAYAWFQVAREGFAENGKEISENLVQDMNQDQLAQALELEKLFKVNYARCQYYAS